MRNESHLIVFVKAPRPGMVKTRLAERIGSEPAAEAYRILAETLLESLRELKHVELCYAPRDATAEFQAWLRPGWSLTPQSDGNLGDRLKNAVKNNVEAGGKQTILVGSDCPYVTSADIDSATAALHQHDMVVGPADDGGYWLIGLNGHHPEIFDGIEWSTERVLGQTLERANQLGLTVATLRTLTDVDTKADWDRFQSQRS